MGSTQSSRPNTKTNNFYQLIQDIKKGTPDIIKIIKEFPNWKELEISDVIFMKNQWNLLHLASWQGNFQLCTELIRMGVDSNKPDFVKFIQNHETPLHLAAWRGHYKAVKALLDTSDTRKINIVRFI